MTTSSTQDQALTWFIRLSDQDTPETAWLEFQTWLEADPAHARAYDLIEQVWVALDEPAIAEQPVVSEPANDDAPTAESIALKKAGMAGRRTWLTSVLATAAAAVVIVGLWPEISGAGRFQTFTTDEAPREIELSDGSHMSMNRHSQLKARIGARDRDVVMSGGEVAFDISHDASRPFVVSSAGHEVRVLGTAFNVVSHDGDFSVGVARGRVAVSGVAMTNVVQLGVGERIDQSGAALPVVSRMDPAQASAWRQGVLIYRNADLNTVAGDLSRYLDKPVNVSSSAEALRFTGALRIGDETTMLGQLQDFVPIRATRETDGIRLTARGG